MLAYRISSSTLCDGDATKSTECYKITSPCPQFPAPMDFQLNLRILTAASAVCEWAACAMTVAYLGTLVLDVWSATPLVLQKLKLMVILLKAGLPTCSNTSASLGRQKRSPWHSPCEWGDAGDPTWPSGNIKALDNVSCQVVYCMRVVQQRGNGWVVKHGGGRSPASILQATVCRQPKASPSAVKGGQHLSS